ncbi:hypothetical protein HHK36_025296 [Tetracentron sinense]|uniref:AMP-activated protein kinase glycogen-binding domain-containing protein n=1 Tax=Tetracentron sinense TaxID=13715 RepID=A0A835D4X5_TETSI|nr:hypothetical protein HHK36_025296 [Tetracentron sinense]
MVTTRFVWPYGGYQVFLSGSFTMWTERSPMTLVEGSSMVFQAICNLAPGYHQYKFLVDGVWRIDEQHPYVADEYGGMNNIIIVKEPEIVPSILRSEASTPKSSMYMGNGFFQQPASLSDGMDQEPVLHISDGNIDVSRRQLSILLSRYTTYELFPESGKVFALDVKLPVKQAFHIMYEQVGGYEVRSDHTIFHPEVVTLRLVAVLRTKWQPSGIPRMQHHRTFYDKVPTRDCRCMQLGCAPNKVYKGYNTASYGSRSNVSRHDRLEVDGLRVETPNRPHSGVNISKGGGVGPAKGFRLKLGLSLGREVVLKPKSYINVNEGPVSYGPSSSLQIGPSQKEAKSFVVVGMELRDRFDVKITEHNKMGFSSSVWVLEEAINWLENTLKEFIETSGYLFRKIRCRRATIVGEKQSNDRGEFIAIQTYLGAGIGGLIFIPKGARTSGWGALLQALGTLQSNPNTGKQPAMAPTWMGRVEPL